MATLNCGWIAANIGAGAAGSTVDLTDAGLGFTPASAFLFTVGRTETTSGTGGSIPVQGCEGLIGSDGTQGCVAWGMGSSSPQRSQCIHYTTQVLVALPPTGATAGKASFNSFIANGVRLNIDQAFTADIRVMLLVLGGSALTQSTVKELSYPSAAGTFNWTSVGFQATAAILLGSRSVTAGTAIASINNAVGLVADNGAGGISQGVVSWWVQDVASGAATAKRYGYGAECVAQINATPATVIRAAATAFTSTGLTLNVLEGAASTSKLVGLFLQGPVAAVVQVRQDNAGMTATAGFQPTGLLAVSHGLVQSTQDVIGDDAVLMLGGGTGPTARGAQSMRHVHLNATHSFIRHDEVLIGDVTSVSAVVDSLLDLGTVTSTGATFVMDDTSGAAYDFWVLALGDGTVSASGVRSRCYFIG